jgi:hypothetical protein
MLLTIFIVLMVIWLVSLTPPAVQFAPYSGWVAFLAVLVLGLAVFSVHV